jgi:hypothetical protein
MSPAVSGGPLSVQAFLFGDEGNSDAVESFSRSLGERDAARSAEGLRHLSGSAVAVVNREIATVASGVLDLNLGDLLVSGWRKYSKLVQAAERTVATPGSEEVVVLASHRVTSSHQPYVDLFIDDVKVMTLKFALKVVFDLNGLVAVVRSGELTALRSGECVVTATLALEDVPLTQRQRRIDLAVVMPLDRPVHLVDTTAAEVEVDPEERPRTATPYLEVVSPGPLHGQRLAISRDELVVGRSPGSDVRLDDPTVSRTHARLRRDGDRFSLQDLGSTGGTKVNGSPITGPHPLKTGDLVSIATVDLMYQAGEP